MYQLSDDLMKKLLDKMPGFPPSVAKIMNLSSEADISVREIVDIIKYDPVITVKILSLVNSAFYGLRNRVTGLNQAVVLLGIQKTRNLLLSIAAIGSLPRIKGFDVFTMDDFLMHSLATAVISRRLSEIRPSGSDPEEFFIAGLLHDFGKILFLYYKPEDYLKAIQEAKTTGEPVIEAEARYLGKDHTWVGRALAQKWNLSLFLQTCIKEHHNPQCFVDPAIREAAYVFIANMTANTLRRGMPDKPSDLVIPEYILKFMDMDADQLLPRLLNLEEEIEKARIFIEMDTI